MFQLRLTDFNQDLLSDVRRLMRAIHFHQDHTYKLQFGFSVLLHKPSTGEYRVFWAMNSTRGFYKTPVQISKKDDLEEELKKLESEDLMTHMIQDRPETSWILIGALSITVYVYKYPHRFPLIGSLHNCVSPSYTKHHPHIRILDDYPDTKRAYNDQLCIWRSIAFNIRGKKTVRIQNQAKQLSEDFRSHMGIDSEKYDGSIPLDSMFQVELFIKARIFIYELELERPKDLSNLNSPTAWKRYTAKLIYPPVCSAIKSSETKYNDMHFVIDANHTHVSPITNINKFANR